LIGFFTVKAKFGHSGKIVVDYKNGGIEFFITSIPYKGKANKDIFLRLPNHFGIKMENILIARGMHSKTKVIEIAK
jgi:uncharacterized protein YggU (UPF0235/DUF167 family)